MNAVLVKVEVRGDHQWGEIYQTGNRLDVYDPDTHEYQGFIEEKPEDLKVTPVALLTINL